MASSSAVGHTSSRPNPTSGSDAGTQPHLADALTVSFGSERLVLDLSAASSGAVSSILASIEKALTTGATDLESCVDELSKALVIGPLSALTEEARESITGVDGDSFADYVSRSVGHACVSALEGVLTPADAEHISSNLSHMVITKALQAQPLANRLSSQNLLSEFRRHSLAALRDLKSVRSSFFSPEWREWYLQVPPGSPPPPRRAANVDAADGPVRPTSSSSRTVGGEPVSGPSHLAYSHRPFSAQVTVVGASSNPASAEVVDDARKRLAHKDADKAANAFKGGPYTGIDDPRGLSGFWRQLESFVVRRGWCLKGPEHYFLLTNLVSEDDGGDAMDEEAPLTVAGYAQAVECIHQALLDDCGGSLEAEKLLSETIVRRSDESLTSFISKIDKWAKRCKSAGVDLSDGHIIKAYRGGVNDASCKEASYEYPSTWREFRARATVRAARVDTERTTEADVAKTTRAEQPKVQARDKGGQVRQQGGQKPSQSVSVCRQYLRGACNYGDRCKFSHASGPREECRQWLNGHCRFGDRCVYAHSKKPSDTAAGPTAGKKPSALKMVQESPSNERDQPETQPPDEEHVQMLWALSEPSHGGESGKQLHGGPTLLFEVAGEQRPLQALLDSGAVRNYIPQSTAESRGWEPTPSDAVARLADGSTLKVLGKVSVIAVHDGIKVPLDFHLLPPRADAGGRAACHGDSCILGTHSMCALGISLRFSEDEGKRKVVIGRSQSSQVDSAKELAHGFRPQPESQALTGGYGTIKVLNEVVTVRFHQEDSLCCVDEATEVLSSLPVESDSTPPPEPGRKVHTFDESWCSVRGAPQYAVRLRPIREDEEKDCPDQTHVAEVRWSVTAAPPGTKTLKPPTDFSIPLYNRLTEDQKRTFKQEIAKFTSRGWWTETQSVNPERPSSEGVVEDEEQLPEAVAFPVPQGQVKVRPCVDVRQCNRLSPSSSYVGASCPVILSQIRLALAQIAAKARAAKVSPLLTLETLDCMTAFYRVRLHRKCALIRCLGRVYAARRLVFGLRCGPAVLEEVLHRLVDAARESLPKDSGGLLPLYHFVYVDDLTLLGDSRAVCAFKAALVRIGASWGFEFAPAKMHSINFDVEGRCDPFDGFTHLGVGFVAQPVACNRCELRLRCTHIPLPLQGTLQTGSKITKRCAFKIAGAAFDALSVHGEQSLAGDIVRRVSGRWKTSSWDESVELARDEAIALNLALKVLRDKPSVCDHPVCFQADYLDLYADASPSGMGIVALLTKDDKPTGQPQVPAANLEETVLCRKAKIWKNAQYNWHQNRKEAFALAGAYLFLNSVVAYVYPLKVRFWSDSHTAISWVTGGNKLTCKSLERVAISRLVEAMADLREVWRRRHGLVPVTYHLAGKENSLADDLSRLSIAWKVPVAVLQRSVPHVGSRQGGTLPAEDSSPGNREDDGPGGEAFTCGSYDTQLFALADADVLAPPERYVMSAGRPARDELLKLQWRSPCLRAIFSALGAAVPEGLEVAEVSELARELAKELPDFSLAQDGLLMKRVSTTRVHNARGARLCYAVPSDFEEGKQYAHDLVSAYHSVSGCLSQRHLRWLVGRTFYMSGLRTLVASVCRACPDCQFGSNRRYYSLLDSGRTLTMGVSGPWQTVSVDIADMVMDRTNKYSCALFLIDHYSSYCLVHPLPDMKAPTVSRAVESYIMTFGSMLTLRSDAGPCFRGAHFIGMLKKYGVRHKMTGPFAPFSNGMVERAISSIKFVSRSLKSKRNWPQFLHRVIFRLNAKVLNHVELSPFDVFFGRSLRLPNEVALENNGPATEAGATLASEKARKETRDEIDQLVRAALRIRDDEVSTARGHLRRGPPAVGSMVLVFEPGIAGKGGSYGQQPYVVNDILDGVTLKLSKVDDPSSTKTSHYLNTRPYYGSSGGHVRV